MFIFTCDQCQIPYSKFAVTVSVIYRNPGNILSIISYPGEQVLWEILPES